ncbi:MAG: hypothetical protein BroJett018_37690 [Chloroflexota bacterium]|nr:hypothetical protein [Chloroflexota bacterium]NOG64428.1 hypothetical protein [Chloroflexota bacterium]GIK65975.1 MAG: hypothetical protein BroJett018_37690 [Chloroflexota bacterium]
MNSELRKALSDLLENDGREWHQTTSELFQDWFNKLASEGFVDSKSSWLKIAGQGDYPAMSYQITEAGLEALGYQSCLECEGTGVDDYDFETKTKTSCLHCQGKGYIPVEPEPPEYDADKAEREHEAALDAIEAERDLKAYRAEHGDDAPDPLEEIEIEHAEMGDAEDYDQLRIERGEFETENYQLKQQLAAVTAERDKLREAATYAMNFVDRLGADSPVVFGGEADVYHKLRAALGFDSE